jgi:hypothetical protein
MGPRDKVVFQDTAWTFHRQVSDEISWKTAGCASVDIHFVDSHFTTEIHFTSTDIIPVDLQVTRSVWAGQMARAIPGAFPTDCGFMLAAAAIQSHFPVQQASQTIAAIVPPSAPVGDSMSPREQLSPKKWFQYWR